MMRGLPGSQVVHGWLSLWNHGSRDNRWHDGRYRIHHVVWGMAMKGGSHV